jgi:ArsR family transcriptional regulator, arsenate/arsenite/antimonite-responsive transcriptional repressor
MVQAKTQLFDKELNQTARMFRALSHPARLQILKFLAETKMCITGEISDDSPLGRTTVNQHLAELKDAGLITGHTNGAKTHYCLNTQQLTEARKSLEDFFNSLDMDGCQC